MRALDDLDGAVDAGAEPARIGEQDVHAGDYLVFLRGACLASRPNRAMPMAPTTIAESATLKAGQECSCQCHWMKSTTWPWRRRSITLPSAPPITSANGSAVRQSRARRARQPERQQAADHEGQHGEEPVLPAAGIAQETEGRAGVVAAVPVPEAFDDDHRLVFGQARKHPALGELVQHDDRDRQQQPRRCVGGSAHQKNILVSPGPSTLLTQRPHNCGCAATVPTSPRCCQQRTHLVFCVGAAVTPISCALSSAHQVHVAADQQEAQFVDERREPVLVGNAATQADLGFQRRADRAVGAHRFQHLGHLLAQRQQAVDVFERQHRAVGERRKPVVPRREQHVALALARDLRPHLVGGERQDRRDPAHEGFRDAIHRRSAPNVARANPRASCTGGPWSRRGTASRGRRCRS